MTIITKAPDANGSRIAQDRSADGLQGNGRVTGQELRDTPRQRICCAKMAQLRQVNADAYIGIAEIGMVAKETGNARRWQAHLGSSRIRCLDEPVVHGQAALTGRGPRACLHQRRRATRPGRTMSWSECPGRTGPEAVR
jgi:hypothetical protein